MSSTDTSPKVQTAPRSRLSTQSKEADIVAITFRSELLLLFVICTRNKCQKTQSALTSDFTD